MYRRDIHFTDETRSEIDTWYNLNWWTIGGTHIKYDHTTGKLGLCSLNNTIINEYHTCVLKIGSGLDYSNIDNRLFVKIGTGLEHDEVKALCVKTGPGFTNTEEGAIKIGSLVIRAAGDSIVEKDFNSVLQIIDKGLELRISTGLNVDDGGYLYINYDKLAEALFTRMTNIAAPKASERE